MRSQRADRADLVRGAEGVRPLTGAQIDLMMERYVAKLAARGISKAEPPPIVPRSSDARAYERALRRIVLARVMLQLRSGLSRAAAASQAIAAIDGLDWALPEGLVAEEVAAHAAKLDGYHKKRLVRSFRSALGIDVRPLLNDYPVRHFMNAWRRENISLIRTIPERLHQRLYRRMTETFAESPFDRQAMSRIVAAEGRVSGYELRRIARDQTSKAIGQFNRIRHQQIGIEEYIWRTAQDERVRETHAALDGTRQRYDSPPSVGDPGSDIMCRCVAIPVIPEVTRSSAS